MAIKNVAPQSSKRKGTGSLSHRSYEMYVISIRRSQIIEIRSMEKAAM